MNIHGYKMKAKGIGEMLKHNMVPEKVQRLEKAKINCKAKIKELKNKPIKKRQFRKVRKARKVR